MGPFSQPDPVISSEQTVFGVKTTGQKMFSQSKSEEISLCQRCSCRLHTESIAR